LNASRGCVGFLQMTAPSIGVQFPSHRPRPWLHRRSRCIPRTTENGLTSMGRLSSEAQRAVMAVISDDHNAEAGEAALRQIVAMVSQIGGDEALEDLAVELALKVADLVEQIASDQRLPAADVAEILFID
jgi:hypothetical protein